ncbi:MAG: RCC1 domain-containing protein, partial [Persicimonas sp.]
GLDGALDALAGHKGGVGAGGRSLTMLIDSKDMVEVDHDAPGVDKPPELPDGEPEDTSSGSSRSFGKTAFFAGFAALIALGAYVMGDDIYHYLPGVAPQAAPGADASYAATAGGDGPDAAVDASGAAVSRDADIGLQTGLAGDASDAGTAVDDVDADDADDASDGGDAADIVEVGPALEPWAMTQISAGKYHTCGVRSDGKMRCWGANFEGELGLGHKRAIGDDEAANSADLIDLGAPARQIVAAGDRTASFSCALLEDGPSGAGKVRCWGANEHGQLGYGHTRRLGDDETLDTLADVQVGGAVAQLAAGASTYGSHTCALLDSGDVRCWGSGKFGKLGLGHTNDIGDDEIPASVGTVAVGGQVESISAGKYNTCALMADRSLRCWGWNEVGQLGLGHTRDIGDDEIPASVEPVALGAPVDHVAVGRRHTCAVLEGGEVRCWGWNNKGQLGLGHTDDIGDDETPEAAEPVELSGAARQVAAGALHSCALLDQGKVQCWGDNKFGQLGLGHDKEGVGAESKPASAGTVYLGAPATAIAAGSYHSCALLEDGQVRCWGYNDHGQLGYGHTNNIGDNEPPGSVSNVPID